MVRLSLIRATLSSRGRLLAFMSLAFFFSVFVVVVVADFSLPHKLYPDSHLLFPEQSLSSDFGVLFLSIFFFNLIVSSFLVVSLPGVVFFPLSAILLVYRAVIWGLLIYQLPTWAFLVAVPTLILEGEAYVFAAVAGTVVGVSWIKPKWLYRQENFVRIEALKKALMECVVMYVFAAVLLFVAAIVEAATLTMIVW